MRVLSVGNGYPPHHHGGYELIWRSAVEHLRDQGHEVGVLTTDTLTDATEPDPPGVVRTLRWDLKGGEFEPPVSSVARRPPATTIANSTTSSTTLRPDVVAWWSMGGLSLTMLETVRRRQIPAVAFVLDEWLDYGRWADAWLHTFTGPATRTARADRQSPRRRTDHRRARLRCEIPVHQRLHARAGGVTWARAPGHRGCAFGRQGRLPRSCSGQGVGVATPLRRPDRSTQGNRHRHRSPAAPAGRSAPQHRRAVGTRLKRSDCGPSRASSASTSGSISPGSAMAPISSRPTGRPMSHCFPVRWDEPWGLVPIEAMGRGTPVIATGRGGSGEYLRDGENCLLFEADDELGLAAAITRLAESEELRARLRAGGIETAARFTEPRYNEEVEAALLEAVDRSSDRVNERRRPTSRPACRLGFPPAAVGRPRRVRRGPDRRAGTRRPPRLVPLHRPLLPLATGAAAEALEP